MRRPHGVCRPEIERPKINSLIGRIVRSMEGKTNEAPLLNISSLFVEFDRPLREFNTLDPGQTGIIRLIQMNALLRGIDGKMPVHDVISLPGCGLLSRNDAARNKC